MILVLFIPALREKYQPLSIIASLIRGYYGKSREEFMKKNRNQKIFDINIKRLQKNYDKSLINYDEKLNNLKSLVNYFETKGVKIFFLRCQ